MSQQVFAFSESDSYNQPLYIIYIYIYTHVFVLKIVGQLSEQRCSTTFRHHVASKVFSGELIVRMTFFGVRSLAEPTGAPRAGTYGGGHYSS